MFDIGGWEFLLIAILGIIIIGPKELPGAIRAVSMFVRRAREMAQEFQSGLEEVAQEAELKKLAETVKTAVDPMERVRREIKDSVDPDENIKDAINFDNELTNDDLGYYDDPELTKDNEIAPSDPEHSPREEENPETELDKPEKSV